MLVSCDSNSNRQHVHGQTLHRSTEYHRAGNLPLPVTILFPQAGTLPQRGQPRAESVQPAGLQSLLVCEE